MINPELKEKLSPHHKNWIETIEVNGLISHDLFKDLGYDPKLDPSALEKISNHLSIINKQIRPHRLKKISPGSYLSGFNPVVVLEELSCE